MRAIAALFVMLLLLLPGAAPAQQSAEMVRAWELSRGEERILSFVSDVTVAKNGDLDVTETIRLVSLAQEIKRGIQRDFPTSYTSRAGTRTSVGFYVISVKRDGHDEPWELISMDNGVRVRVGDADVMLPPAEHVYEIRYRTTRQIFYGPDYDELYWNATGTSWTFPIDMAEARIRLPAPARFGDRAVYTGPQGATMRNADVIQDEPGLIVFRTNQPLPAWSGLTVAAAFPKGVLDAPSAARRFGWWLRDWGAMGAALLSLLALAGYYVWAWLKAGRGPSRGTIVPIFTPPDGLSAAGARYVSRMKMDNRAFSAAIVDLGVRGCLRIRKEDGGWFAKDITTLDKVKDGPDLPPPEAGVMRNLFAIGDSIELKQANHSTLQSAQRTLENELEKAYCGPLFLKHRDWAMFGAACIPAAILFSSWVAIAGRLSSVPFTEFMSPLFGIAGLLAAWWLHGLSKRSEGRTKALAWLGAAGGLIVGGMCAMTAVTSALSDRQWPVLLPLLALPLTISAFKWMYAPTREGRAVMDRIAGFRHYMSITEERRLETLHPPEKTPELFERYLPYAIALDVENRWAKSFATVLAAAAAAGTAAHTASWYSGEGNFWDDPQGFANTMGSSLASTVSSASTSPSSSGGGSSGGGSSGGGGGGGGGSGW